MHLLDTGALDLHQLELMDISDADRAQVAQLLGYSVSGFGDLGYVTSDVVAYADVRAAAALADQDS